MLDMAIIHFRTDRNHAAIQPYSNEPWPDGAHCPLDQSNGPERRSTHGTMVLWETYAGFCIFETERNGYDDSDFFMTVWDEATQAPTTIMFGTTRCWSGPSMGSRPDATPEVREAYSKWQAKQEAIRVAAHRTHRAQELLVRRREIREAAAAYSVPLIRLRTLINHERRERSEGLLRLLKSTRIRNKFKVSLRERLVAWLQESEPKFASPFSQNQWQYI
jgi:hypothetical protein